MRSKTAFGILAFTLVAAVLGMGVISNGGIAGGTTYGKAVMTIRPSCPPGFNDLQHKTEPMPNYCYAGTNPDGSISKNYMCCNEYYSTKQTTQPRYYKTEKKAPVGKYY